MMNGQFNHPPQTDKIEGELVKENKFSKEALSFLDDVLDAAKKFDESRIGFRSTLFKALASLGIPSFSDLPSEKKQVLMWKLSERAAHENRTTNITEEDIERYEEEWLRTVATDEAAIDALPDEESREMYRQSLDANLQEKEAIKLAKDLERDLERQRASELEDN